MNVRAAKAGLAIQEIPSYEYLRLHGMSNLNVVRDGIRIAKFILRERFRLRERIPGHSGQRPRQRPSQADGQSTTSKERELPARAG